jgi:endonuclease/exonuclease/phosphatase (EEP) superfamily protein YafD
MQIILYALSIFFVVSSYLPATEIPHWFFRTPDFVRLQSLAIKALLIIASFFVIDSYTIFFWAVILALAATIVYEIVKVFPYSSWYPREKPDHPSDGMVSIFAGNVLQHNSEYEKFLAEVERYDPDLVLTMESNKAWEDGISRLEKTYPHTVKVPNEKLYGMHLYSRIPLQNLAVHHLIESHVPSIFCEISLNEDTTLMLVCLHPAPPSPTENETSEERDAELMIVGKKIRDLDQPVVVCGDMNDVVWSRTTRLFKKMTAMIDPRVGRGFFPTYHADYRLMRFPLDHLFHTKDLYVGKMERSAHFGSDHFAMYYEIHHKQSEAPDTNGDLNGDEKQEVEEKIENGKK